MKWLLGVVSVVVGAALLLPGDVRGAGGTSIVAKKGSRAYVDPNLPEGVAEIINHPRRTTGWNDWFTEWPSDVKHYALEVESTAEINDLLKKLAAVEGKIRAVRLSFDEEPGALGWVTRVDKGSRIPVMFSVGNQQQVDRWYAHVRKPFGQLEFADTPVAVPPTLTIYAGNKTVDLEKLEIPDGLEVSRGGTPGPFYRWNLVDELKKGEGNAQETLAREDAKLEEQLASEQKERKRQIDKMVKDYAERQPADDKAKEEP